MVEKLVSYSFGWRNQKIDLKVPETLHESIKLHAENRKVPLHEVYCEAIDGKGMFAEQIKSCEGEYGPNI